MKTIDARGLSCPEPVVLLRSAMSTGEDSYQIIVDNPEIYKLIIMEI